MSSHDRPKAIVQSDAGSNRGMLLALIVLVLVIAAAVWFSNQSASGEPRTAVTVDVPALDADPGTETTIFP